MWRAGERAGRRLLMGDAGKDADERLAVPRLAGVLTLELIDEPGDFTVAVRHGPHSSSSAPGSSTSSFTLTRNLTASAPSTMR